MSDLSKSLNELREAIKNDTPLKTTTYQSLGGKIRRKTGMMKPSELRKARKKEVEII